MTHTLFYQDDTLHSVFHGNLTSVPEPASRVLKLFVSSTKADFEQERRHLHDVVLPELQRHCSSLGVDVLLVDIQHGSDEDVMLSPRLFAQQLEELENCHRTSMGHFLLSLVGNKYKVYPLPFTIDAKDYTPIYNAASDAGLDVSLLDQRYHLSTNLIPPAYVWQEKDLDVRKEYFGYNQESNEEQDKITKIIQYGARIARQEGLLNGENNDKGLCFASGVHAHLNHGLKLSKSASHRVICVVRQFEGVNFSDPAASAFFDLSSQDGVVVEEDNSSGVQNILEDIIVSVNRKNVSYFSVPWHPSGLDADLPDHAEYLRKFGNHVLKQLKAAVDEAVATASNNWDSFPPLLRKPVQEVMRESQTHLCNCRHYLRELGVSQSLDIDCGPLLQIQQLMLEEERMRHTPIIVCGKNGCGKSTVLSQVIMYCTEWLGDDVIRIVRHVGQSPCSTYTPELLRNLCIHISLVFGFDVSPKHHSYELGKLSIWFQDLLKMVESTTTDLVIVLDDLQELRSPPSNQAAILGWLPWNLPANVHIICSICEEAETVLGLLKSRVSMGDSFVQIPPLNAAAAVSMLQSNLKDDKHSLTQDQTQAVKQRLTGENTICSLYVKVFSYRAEQWPSWKSAEDIGVPDTLEDLVNLYLSGLEETYGLRTVSKMASFLACTSYGLREPELAELFLSTIEVPSADNQRSRSSSWFGMIKEMRALLKEYYVDRRPYLHWSHRVIAECVKKRYMGTNEELEACHDELAGAFHLGFIEENEGKDSPTEDQSRFKKKHEWCDILREIDEMWFHLVQSGDVSKLKTEAICNFEFLLSAVSGASISYIRSILELVRCQVLDWEVELLYTVTKQAVDILSQDPEQIATEILNWIKPFSDGNSPVLDSLVQSALRWCNNNKNPLLVPQNCWLTLTLPPQVLVMSCPHPIIHMVPTQDSQHVLCSTTEGKDIEMYHLPSRSLYRSLKGHKAKITCLHVTRSGRWLISGSEDTDVLIWEISTGEVKNRMSHHIAGILCVTTTNSETLVLSGSEIGLVVVARLDTGQAIQKLENHRGVISCVAVNSGDDIFATGSTDKTVCIWSLEDFVLLNTITISSPICKMDISKDSTFLLLACEDNTVHVRSLTTGSDVHCLYGYNGAVSSICCAYDNCRCVICCHDGKCYIFDIHSARLLQTLSGHSEPVTSVQAQDKDRFLVTSGGNKIVVWNFNPPKKESGNHHRPKIRKIDNHRDPVSCVAVSRDGTLAVSGSKDTQIKVWHVNTGEIHTTLEGHTGTITCVAFAPNGLFVVSGSEDTTLWVWGLTLGQVEATFKEHQHKITGVSVTLDSRRVLSVDAQGYHRVWMADNGNQLYVCPKPSNNVSVHGNIVFAVTGGDRKNDNSLKFWPIMDVEDEKSVSHSDVILCYTVTHDGRTIITGSQDMSLKVWEGTAGKLTQVLVGHEGAVQCVAVAPYSPRLVVSGSADCNLILWDMMTGTDNFTLRSHTESVTWVKLTLDGSVAVSAAADNTLQLWNTKNGERIAILDLHISLVNVAASLNVSHLVVQIANNTQLPVVLLHNNPAKGMTVELPQVTLGSDDIKSLGPLKAIPKRILLRGNLKREQSFDSLYWDLKSASPKHEMLSNLDDLKRSASPFGSREHLPIAGSVWDGTKGRLSPRGPGVADNLGMQPKPKLPKHKLLKKQQSMFAFFPESSHNQGPQITVPLFSKELDKKHDFLSRVQLPKRLEAATKQETSETTPVNDDSDKKNSSDVKDSSVCSIA